MQVTQISDKKVLYTFYGIGDYVEVANSNPYCNAKSSSRTKENNSWHGGSYEEAVEQSQNGNPELVQALYDGVSGINAMIEQDHNAYIRDVTGEFFDVGDFLSGEPECWWKDKDDAGQKQVVPVYVNIALNYGTSNEVCRNRGSAIVSLCDMLQQNGFIVDLNVVCAKKHSWRPWSDHEKKWYEKVVVPTDPIDLDMLAFMIANPLFHRRLEFSITEFHAKRAYPYGYGTPCEYDLPDILDTGVSGFYFVSSNHRIFDYEKYEKLEAAKNHIMEMIEQFKQDEKQVIFG